MEPEEREQKKADKLRKLFRENDYDSGDEREKVDEGAPAKPESEKAPAVAGGQRGASVPFRGLLEEFVDAVDKKQNLLDVACDGEAVPVDLQIDLARAVARHQEAQERKLRAREERGARTAQDTLNDQMEELRAGLETLDEGTRDGVAAILAEGDIQGPSTRLGVRSFVSRRLFAALGEALFECQRFKSKENEAVFTPEGEMAFVAMYLRRHAGK